MIFEAVDYHSSSSEEEEDDSLFDVAGSSQSLKQHVQDR